MQKLAKNAKRLSMLLLVSAAAGLSGCQTISKQIPGAKPPPVIKIYSHYLAEDVALCSRTDGASCPALPMEKTDKFYMISETDWRRQEDYIDDLICILNGGCGSSIQPAAVRSSSPLLKDLQNLRSRMQKIKQTLRRK